VTVASGRWHHGGIMKSARILLPLCAWFLLPAESRAQEFLEFKDIVAGSYDALGSKAEQGILPKHVMLNTIGGNLEATLKVKQRGDDYCFADYRFEWKFSQPVDRLYEGVSVNVDYRVTLVQGPCVGDQGKMIVAQAGGFSPVFRATGIRPRPGIRVVDGKWIQTGDASYGSTAKIQVFDTTGPAVFKLNLESVAPVGSSRLHYELVYVYE
jgi:hypothetical protein